MSHIENRNPYESENDRDVQYVGNTGREWGLKLNKGVIVTLMAMVGSTVASDSTNPAQLMNIYNVTASLWIAGMHYYLKSEAKPATENIMGRGIVEDILHNRGKELTARYPGSKRIAEFFSDTLLSAPRHYRRQLSNAAIVQQVSGDLFTLLKKATETVNKDKLMSIYSQYREVDVNTLHLAVMLGADHSEDAVKLKAHEALSDPLVQRIFTEGKRLLPTLAEHLPSTRSFLRNLRGALGDDAYYILKEPTNSLKAVKEYNTLCLNMITAGAKHADAAYSYQVLNEHTRTIIDACEKGTLSLPMLMTRLNDIQSIKEVVTPQVLHYEQQNRNTEQPSSPLRPLMEGCDRVLRKYRPLFKKGVDALPDTLKQQLFSGKHEVELSGFILDTPQEYRPKTWPDTTEQQLKKVQALLYRNTLDPMKADPKYAFMLGVEQCLEKAILSSEHFYNELNNQPRLQACQAIVERVLQRTLLSQLAHGDIAPPATAPQKTAPPTPEPPEATMAFNRVLR